VDVDSEITDDVQRRTRSWQITLFANVGHRAIRTEPSQRKNHEVTHWSRFPEGVNEFRKPGIAIRQMVELEFETLSLDAILNGFRQRRK
jgi:hypothetical protein